MASRAATSSERSGTMQNGMPVDTVWMGSDGSRSSGMQADSVSNRGGIVDCAEDGIVLAHGAVYAWTILLHGESNGNGPDTQIERDGAGAAQEG